ncbi:tetratricopeptide repeat protein 22 [Brienomyrus brachyistius]|uniref:tetratricopeptide repeat protein 22 n=1 Tax=Brienomyrus brachyistius TaxID=42636 RepID=UPI0020B2BF2B|nr:tetratricopeptide repeat protein 22 [Brienomyrus brachyistius]
MDGGSMGDDIEALIEDMEYIPGHFHLDLHLNCEPHGPPDLRSRDVRLKRESLRAELEAESGPQQYAVRNLLGLLTFHLDEPENAEEAFRSICEEEPGNLNAWANLGHVYDQLKREAEGAECVEKVSVLMGLASGEAAKGQSRLLAARCLAEQAYAHLYDVELDNEEDLRERLTVALTLYHRALDYGGQMIPTEEKRSWYFKMATLYIRLDSLEKGNEDSEFTRVSHFNKALKLLTEAIKSEKTHNKALAWCYVGVMLERKDEFAVIPMSVHDCGYSGSDPLCCYGTAIKTAKDDAFILNRLASVFYLLGKYDMAMGICNMALNVLPDAELNWQGYCMRAKINVTAYKRDLEKAKSAMAGIPDRRTLDDAKADLEHVLSVRPCLKTHLDMGQVYYYMGVDALQESLLVDERALNAALVSLAQALQCELGDSLPEVQMLRGRCLLLKGEEHNAAECFKRALELEPPGSRDTAALRCLLETMLVLFCQKGPDQRSLIDQLEAWLRRAEERHPADAVQAELRAFCRAHTDEVAELSRALIRAGRLELVRRLLETMQPGRPAARRPFLRSMTV